MASIVQCDSCGEAITPKMSDPTVHQIRIAGRRSDRVYDLCDVCRPTFLRLMRQMLGAAEMGNVNLRTQVVTLAVKTKAESVIG